MAHYIVPIANLIGIQGPDPSNLHGGSLSVLVTETTGHPSNHALPQHSPAGTGLHIPEARPLENLQALGLSSRRVQEIIASAFQGERRARARIKVSSALAEQLDVAGVPSAELLTVQ